jgi:hypothetical protein
MKLSHVIVTWKTKAGADAYAIYDESEFNGEAHMRQRVASRIAIGQAAGCTDFKARFENEDGSFVDEVY